MQDLGAVIYRYLGSIERIAGPVVLANMAFFLAISVFTGVGRAEPVVSRPLQAGNSLMEERIDQAQPGDEQCLAMAVYYESGNEPRSGQEAVAQVVLNRLAHPHYPKSICTVVWQGAQRRTGCQFTFTCDGSLARRPVGPAWEEARDVARSALLVAPRPDLANALNYHADYVRPGWASTLRLVAQVGRHIFYARPENSAVAGVAVPDRAGSAAMAESLPRRDAGPSVWGISLAAATRR